MTTETEKKTCTKAEPQKEHEWLKKMVGEWTIEGECTMGPDQPAQKSHGKETVRSLGDLWIVAEGEMTFEGDVGQTRMTLGFDPRKKKFVGTWVGSMMSNMWVYEGELDSAKKVLPLDTVGPDFVNVGKELKYQDIIEIVNDDHRILRSQMQGEDGKWTPIMTAHYKRKK